MLQFLRADHYQQDRKPNSIVMLMLTMLFAGTADFKLGHYPKGC